MGRIAIIILILNIVSYGQLSRGQVILMDISSPGMIDADNVHYVSALAGEFATITSALSISVAGDLILLAPEYFNEDIQVSLDSISIKGLDLKLTIINKLTVTGKDCSFQNFTLLDSLNVIRSVIDEWHYLSNKNSFERIDFYGNCNLGIPGTQLLYPFEFRECSFLGNSTRIYFNCYPGGQSNYFYNSYINGWSGIADDSSSNIDVVMEEGQVVFDGRHIYIDTLLYEDPAEVTLVYLQNMSQCSINHIIMSNSIVQFKVLTLKHGFYLFNSDMLFQGRFELNIEHSQLNLGWDGDGLIANDIIFNSIANSRITHVQQLGYESASTISGTGLNNLHIFQSIFHMSVPTGLGSDANNSWDAFIDN